MMLTVFDYVVLAVIALSALRGAWRGLITEVFGLIGWFVAIVIAGRYAGAVAPLIPANWPGGELTQWVAAFAAIAICVVLVASVVNALLARIVQVSGLGGADRSLGLMFGLVRGALLVVLLVAAAGFTDLPKQNFWRNALLRPTVEQGVLMLKPFVTDGVAQYLRV